MALYPCPECKREISTDAMSCPHCGKNVRFSGVGTRWRAMPKAVRIFLIVCAAVFALGMCVDKSPDKPKPQAAVPAAPQAKASTPAPAADGSMTIQSGIWFGFRNREAMDKATRLAAQGDKDAWSKFMAQAIMDGRAVELKAGEKVFAEDTAIMSGAVKIRRKGEVSSWWTNLEAVK